MDNAVLRRSSSNFFFVMYAFVPRDAGWDCMRFEGYKISGIKVVNIMEENAEAIETMVNKAIDEIYRQKLKILDIQTTGDNLVLITGKKS